MNARVDNAVGSGFSRRSILAGLGAVGGTLLLAACSGGTTVTGASTPRPTFTAGYDGPKVTLNYWNGLTGGDGDRMLAMVDAFNRAHENIAIKTTSLEWADLYSKIVTAVEAGKGPEIALMQLDQLATFAVRGTIVGLDDVTSALKITEADFSPTVWAGGVFQDKRYGIPLDMFTIAQYWDVDAYDKAGVSGPITSESAYRDTMSALQASGVANPFWVPSAFPIWQMWVSLLAQNGGQLYDLGAEKYTFAGDAGVSALTWLVDQVKSGISPQGVTEARPALMTGKAAMITDGLWSIADFKANAPGLNLGIGAFPQIGASAGAFGNSHNFTLTKQADQDDDRGQASRVFLDWMSRNSIDWASSGNIPARASVREEPAFAGLPQATLSTDEVFDSFAFLPQLPGGRDIAVNTFQAAVGQAVLLQKDPAAALADAQTNAQKQLDENRALYGF